MADTERETFLNALNELEAKRKATRRAQELEHVCASLEAEVARLAELVEVKDGDLRRISDGGLTSFWHGLLGDRREVLGERERARAQAELEHDEAARRLERRRAALREWGERAAGVDEAQAALEAAREACAAAVHEEGGAASRALAELDEGEARHVAELREIDEALVVEEDTDLALEAVHDSLQRSANWGVLDIVGGGPIVTWVKHGGLDRARDEMEEVHDLLDELTRELRDVGDFGDLDVDLDLERGWRFADFFLDGLIVDAMVQSRINGMLRGVEDVQGRVARVGEALDLRRTQVVEQIVALRAGRDELLSS